MRNRIALFRAADDAQFDTVIRASSGIFDIKFSELFRYWDLIVMLFRRNVMLQYKQTALGVMWLFLYPLITSVVFTYVFGQFAGFSTDGIPTFLFYLASNTLWWVFANCLSNTSRTYQSDAEIFKKVYFPRLAAPLAHLLTGLFSFCIRMLMILAAFFVYLFATGGIRVTWMWLLLPIPVLQAGLLGLACGIIITSMTTKYRDMAMIADFGVQLWMFATPVLYAFSSTGGFMSAVLWINPMTAVMENFRYFLFGAGEFMGVSWIVSWAVTLILLIFGIVLYGNVSRSCIDTI